MDIGRYKSLSAPDQALIATAILLDGQDAINYLAADAERGERFASIAAEITGLEPELRLQFLGTLLRDALASIALGGAR